MTTPSPEYTCHYEEKNRYKSQAAAGLQKDNSIARNERYRARHDREPSPKRNPARSEISQSANETGHKKKSENTLRPDRELQLNLGGSHRVNECGDRTK